ncbi:MAG: DUF2851 family protein, partial [Chloroflexota bacterium]|nr:DUF2851 family protein [Chloroflexota bacterium]
TTPEGELRGAVEVHRRSSDWTRHGHGADRRYAGVVLHVVGFDDGGGGRLPGGAQLPLLQLPFLELSHSAGTGSRSPFPCASEAGAGAAPELIPTLIKAGESRFAAAVARLRADVSRRSPGVPSEVWEQVAYEWIAEALGYARNVGPMRDLAIAVPIAGVQTLRPRLGVGLAGDASTTYASTTEAQALFLGSAGLLPSQRHLPAVRRVGSTVAQLEQAWRRRGRPPALRAYRWSAVQVRPENTPLRRVLALAHLALAWPAAGILATVRQTLLPEARQPAGRQDRSDRSDRPSGARTAGTQGNVSAAGASSRLARLVSLPCPEGYWADHWDFGVAAAGAEVNRSAGGRTANDHSEADQRRGANEAPGQTTAPGAVQTGALIGPSRAADVVVNVLLPLAAAAGEEQGDAALTAAAWAAFRSHTALAENWITRLMRERTGLSLARSATAQQGLIALYEGPCRDLRCAECPLSGAQHKP